MAIEIVDLPMKNGVSFHSYISLPERYSETSPTFSGDSSKKHSRRGPAADSAGLGSNNM
jgi:hypothetical protein